MKLKATTENGKTTYQLKLDASWKRISKKEAGERLTHGEWALVVNNERTKLWIQ